MKRKIILLIFMTSLVFCLNICGTPAYAADETLTVSAVWLDGDMLKIEVTDISGVKSSLSLKLSDYVNDSENSEYISIQAADLAGNKSGVIQIKNPYYIPGEIIETAENADKTDEIQIITVEIIPTEQSSTVVANGAKPLTPDGAGTVMDNVFDGDGKEFFTIKTEDGSVFYLIVDRQRNSDNVYLLNAVTEDDLIALAQKKDKNAGNIASIIPTKTPATEQAQSSIAEPKSNGKTGGMNSGMVIFIVVIVAGIGGAGYYFKIVKGKKKAPADDEEDEDFDDKMDDSEDYEVPDDFIFEDGDEIE